MKDIVIIYISIINIVTFCAFGVDKTKAKLGKYRIAEKVLLGLSALGGSVGGLIGMQIFHHKTKHVAFKLGIPVIIVVQYVLFLLWTYREIWL